MTAFDGIQCRYKWAFVGDEAESDAATNDVSTRPTGARATRPFTPHIVRIQQLMNQKVHVH